MHSAFGSDNIVFENKMGTHRWHTERLGEPWIFFGKDLQQKYTKEFRKLLIKNNNFCLFS